MNEIKVKIKLPSEVVVHLPAFSDVDLESVMEIIGTDGKGLVQRVIAEKVLERFLEEHKDFINKISQNVLEERSGEIKVAIREALINKPKE